jgi:hypothetical protein
MSSDSHLWITPVKVRRLLERAEQDRQSGARSRVTTDRPRVHAIRRRLGDDEIAELIRRYEAGESCGTLAGRFKIAKSSVIRLLHTRGVQMRPMHVTY